MSLVLESWLLMSSCHYLCASGSQLVYSRDVNIPSAVSLTSQSNIAINGREGMTDILHSFIC